MAYQTLRIQWFGNTWFSKPNKYNGVRDNGSQNTTYTMVWENMAHQTVQIQWSESPRLTKLCVYNGFGEAWLTKPFKYIGLIVQGLPSVTYTIVWGRIAYQSLQIQWFECPWLITHYVCNGLGTHGSPNITNTMV